MRRRDDFLESTVIAIKETPENIDDNLWQKVVRDKNEYGQWNKYIHYSAIICFFMLAGGAWYSSELLYNIFKRNNTIHSNPPIPPSDAEKLTFKLEAESYSFYSLIVLFFGGTLLYKLANWWVAKKNIVVRADMYRNILLHLNVTDAEELTDDKLQQLIDLIQWLGPKPHGARAIGHIINAVRKLDPSQRIMEDAVSSGVRMADPNPLYDHEQKHGDSGDKQGDVTPVYAEAQHSQTQHLLIATAASVLNTAEKLRDFWQVAQLYFKQPNYQIPQLPLWMTLQPEISANSLVENYAAVPYAAIENVLKIYWPKYNRDLALDKFDVDLTEKERMNYHAIEAAAMMQFQDITRLIQNQAAQLLGVKTENIFYQLNLSNANQRANIFAQIFMAAPPLQFNDLRPSFWNKPLRLEKDSQSRNCGCFTIQSPTRLWPHRIKDQRENLLQAAYEAEKVHAPLLTAQSAMLEQLIAFFDFADFKNQQDDTEFSLLKIRLQFLAPLMQSAATNSTLDPARDVLLGKAIAIAFIHYRVAANQPNCLGAWIADAAVVHGVDEKKLLLNCLQFLINYLDTLPDQPAADDNELENKRQYDDRVIDSSKNAVGRLTYELLAYALATRIFDLGTMSAAELKLVKDSYNGLDRNYEQLCYKQMRPFIKGEDEPATDFLSYLDFMYGEAGSYEILAAQLKKNPDHQVNQHHRPRLFSCCDFSSQQPAADKAGDYQRLSSVAGGE